jgi:hypothetical protein
VGDWFLKGCSSLENVVLPKSLIYVGKYAFEECTSLKLLRLSKLLYEKIKGNISSSVKIEFQEDRNFSWQELQSQISNPNDWANLLAHQDNWLDHGQISLRDENPSYNEFDQVYKEFMKISPSSEQQENKIRLIGLLGEAIDKLASSSGMAPAAKAA